MRDISLDLCNTVVHLCDRFAGIEPLNVIAKVIWQPSGSTRWVSSKAIIRSLLFEDPVHISASMQTAAPPVMQRMWLAAAMMWAGQRPLFHPALELDHLCAHLQCNHAAAAKRAHGLWLAEDPGKRWTEVFFLAYSPFWMIWALCILVPFRLYDVRRCTLKKF